MDKDWIYKVPDLNNGKLWEKHSIKDAAINPGNQILEYHSVGTVDSKFKVFTIVFYNNKLDSNLAAEKCLHPKTHEPFLIRWYFKNLKEIQGVALYVSDKCVIKRINECVDWRFLLASDDTGVIKKIIVRFYRNEEVVIEKEP